MPFVRGSSVTGNVDVQTSITIDGTDRFLLITVQVEDGAASATVSVNGTAVPTTAWDGTSGVIANVGTNERVFGLLNPPTGTSLPVLITTGGGASKGLTVALYDAVDQVTPFDGLQTTNDSGTAPSVVVTSSASNLVVGVALSGGGTRPVASAGAGQTPRVAQNVGDFSHAIISDEAGAGSVTHSYSRTNTASFSALVAAFNLRASGGGGGGGGLYHTLTSTLG